MIPLGFGVGLALWQFADRHARDRELAAEAVVDHELGATVEALRPDTADDVSLPSSTRGVVLTSLADGGLAQTAGLRPGDVVQRIGGAPVESPRQAAHSLAQGARPWKLTVNRHGHKQEMMVGTPVKGS